MLPKTLRLSVESFPKNAKTAFRGPHFTIKTTQGDGRVAVLVGKSKAKKAILRNSLKRLIYNFFKDNQVPSGQDLLIVLNKPIMKLDSPKKKILIDELSDGLNKTSQ